MPPAVDPTNPYPKRRKLSDNSHASQPWPASAPAEYYMKDSLQAGNSYMANGAYGKESIKEDQSNSTPRTIKDRLENLRTELFNEVALERREFFSSMCEGDDKQLRTEIGLVDAYAVKRELLLRHALCEEGTEEITVTSNVHEKVCPRIGELLCIA